MRRRRIVGRTIGEPIICTDQGTRAVDVRRSHPLRTPLDTRRRSRRLPSNWAMRPRLDSQVSGGRAASSVATRAQCATFIMHATPPAGSSCPNRCPRDCCTPSRCAGACACASAEPGSPIASTSSCSSNSAVIRQPPSRRPTSLHTPWNTPTIPPPPDLGLTSWYAVRAGEHTAPRGRGGTSACPAHASELQARVAFAWPAMDAFYEEDERIVGHAADSYHRIDIRQASVVSWFAIVTASLPTPSDR